MAFLADQINNGPMLFALLEVARAESVREFAIAGLKADFKPVLREVEAWWIDHDFIDDKLSAVERLKAVAQGMAY